MEGSSSKSVTSSVLPDLKEDKSLSSGSDGSFDLESVESPQLPHDMISEVGKYLNVKTMKSARLVSSAWNKGLQDEFRRKIIVLTEFYGQMSFQKFFKTFHNANSKLIISNIWIPDQKYLNILLMTNWIETYGNQLTTLRLGDYVRENPKEKIFLLKSIESILTCYCPNLRVLIILTPCLSDVCSIKYINPVVKDLKVALDYLEIGHEDDQCSEKDLTSTFLLNVLKCVRSVKRVKIVRLREINTIQNPEEKHHIADYYGKQVFEKIEELHLLCSTVDPLRLFHFEGSDEMRFNNLQRLKIGCFDCYSANRQDDLHVKLMRYLPSLLISVKDNLKELIFYKCTVQHDINGTNIRRFEMPEMDNFILSSMPKLEIFEIIEIDLWNNPSLDFLEKLPALKQLNIYGNWWIYYVDKYDCGPYPSCSREYQKIFNVNRSTKQIVHQNLEQLTFRCATQSWKDLKNIRFCCPNLKKLEVDFCGTPLFSVFGTFKKLKDLTIHLLQPLQPMDAEDLEELSASGIERLCLELLDENYRYSERKICLGSIVDGCLASQSLKKLELREMEISREDYQSTMEKLKTAQLQLLLINCKIVN